MKAYRSSFWKKAPFVKILLAFIPGILIQVYVKVPVRTAWLLLCICILGAFIFSQLSLFRRYQYSFLQGISFAAIFCSLGMIVSWHKDTRNNKHWWGNFYQEGNAIIVTLEEPPVEKARSFKVDAKARFLEQDGRLIKVKGKIILYFRKDSTDATPALPFGYGSQILLIKPLQEIRNAGNPGGFDYKRYCLFRGFTHQSFLASDEYLLLPGKKETCLKKFIFTSRAKVLGLLRKYIRDEKERGLAEALLIGYKNDLDRTLVQSYTHAGVVHIIAISGLHLGLIYWLLTGLFKPLERTVKWIWLRTILVITGLWIFSLLAGAQPSILRSAFMFTFIAIGEPLGRKTSIYNSLAVSAFLLLCINPFLLYDAGFQLSYAAVLSIIIFMQPIYNWFYFSNKILDFFWKLNAVTLAAQLLTLPVSIYHFHQFPTFFILTNFLAVPLSSLILLGEIALCALAVFPAVAQLLGKLISWLIWIMNTYIEKIGTHRYSLWEGLQIDTGQLFLLLGFVSCTCYWLLERSRNGLKAGLVFLLGFLTIRSLSFLHRNSQKKLIVYNVPHKRAIDLVHGRYYAFVGDSGLLANDLESHFHLKPARVLFRIEKKERLPGLTRQKELIRFLGKNILLLDKSIETAYHYPKPVIDLLVISQNPKIYMHKLAALFELRQVVFDASVPAWKAKYWKKDCDSLRIPWHDVSQAGAFVMNLR